MGSTAKREELFSALETEGFSFRRGVTREMNDLFQSMTDTHRRRVLTALLEQAGLIEWDQRHHEIVQGPRFDAVRPLLSETTETTEKTLKEP